MVNEEEIERVLKCQNCDQYYGSLLYHEARWHYEHYEFDTKTEEFICRKCGSRDVEETFETVSEDGDTTEYENLDGHWIPVEPDGNDENEILRME